MFLVVISWSSLFHLLPTVLHYVTVLHLSFLRYFLAAIALFFIHYYYVGRFIPKLTAHNWMILLLMGILGVCIYNIVFLWAETIISGNIIAIIYSFGPCLMIIISSIAFKERIYTQAIFGIIIALVGAIGTICFYDPCLNINHCHKPIYQNGVGEAVSIFTMLLLVTYNVLGKSLSLKGVKPITITTFASVFGGTLLTILTLYDNNYSDFVGLDLFFWVNVVYIVIGPTILGYLWFIEAYEKIGVQKTSVFLNMMPFLSILLGYLFYNISISPIILFMGLIIFIGVYITNTSNIKR